MLVMLPPPSVARAAWQLGWSDEFDGANLDATKWSFDFGKDASGWGNNEREYYKARTDNAHISGGLLHIVARQESVGGFAYISARIKSQGLFSKALGRLEFRARLLERLSCWPTLWMLGNKITSAGWRVCAEIDVVESQGGSATLVQRTLHYSDSVNGHLSQTAYFGLTAAGDSVTNFHVYAVEWTTNSIKWMLDSYTVQTWRAWSSSTGAYPAPFNQTFFLIMNLAVGGSYLSNPTDTQINAGILFPAEMQSDYVRVYDLAPAPPSQPSGLNVSHRDTKVYLSWSNSTSGASGYNIKRSLSSGGTCVIMANSSAFHQPPFKRSTIVPTQAALNPDVVS